MSRCLPRPVLSVRPGAQGDGTEDNPAMSQFTQTEYGKDYTTKKKYKPINKWRMVRSAYKLSGRPSRRHSRNSQELKAQPSVARLPSIPSLPSISSLYEPAPETMEPICSHSCGIKKQPEISPRGGSPPNTPKMRRRSLRDVGPKVDCWRSFRPTTTSTVEKKDSKLRLQSMLSVVDLLLSASKKENWILRASGYLLALKKEIKFCLDNKILPRLASTNDLPTLYEPRINYKEFNPRRKFYGYVRRLRFDDFYDDEIPHEPCKTLQHETRFLPMVDPTTDIIETKLSVRPKATEKCLDSDNLKSRNNPNENLYDILKSYCIGKSAMQHYIPGPIEHDFIDDGIVTDEKLPEDEEKRLEIKLSSFLKEMFSFSPSSSKTEKSAEAPSLDVADILKRLQMESSKEKNKSHSSDHYYRHEENFYRSKTIKRGNKQLSPSKTPLITSVKLSELIYDNKTNSTTHRHTTEGTSSKKDSDKRVTSTIDSRLKREFESLEMKLRGSHNKLSLKESAHLANILDQIKRMSFQNRKSAAELKPPKKSNQQPKRQPKNVPKDLKFYDGIIAQSSLPDAVCFSRIKKLLRVYKEKQVDEKIRSLITDFSDDQKYGELKENIQRLNEVIGNLAKGNKDWASLPIDARIKAVENPTEKSMITGLEARETINELIQIIDNIKDISSRVYEVKSGDAPSGTMSCKSGKAKQKGKKYTKKKQKAGNLKKHQDSLTVLQEQKVFSSRKGLTQENQKDLSQRNKPMAECRKGLPTESHKQLPNKGHSLKSLKATSSKSSKKLQPKSLRSLVPDSRKSLQSVRKTSKREVSKVSQMSRKEQKSSKGLHHKSSKRSAQGRRKAHKSVSHKGAHPRRKKQRPEPVRGLKSQSRKKMNRRSRKTLKSGRQKKKSVRKTTQSKKGGLAQHQEPHKATQSKSSKTLQPGNNSKSQVETRKLTSNNKTKSPPTRRKKIPSLKRLLNNVGIKQQPSKGHVKAIAQNVSKISSSQSTSQSPNPKQINRQKSIVKQASQGKNNSTPKELPGDMSKTLTHKHDCMVSKSVLEAIKKNPKYIETAVENILKRSHSKQSLISMLLQVIHARLESENGENLGCGDRSKTNRNKFDDMYENLSVTELSFNSPNVSCHSFNYLKNLYDKSTNSFGNQLTKSLAKTYQLKTGNRFVEQGLPKQNIGDAELPRQTDALERRKKCLLLPTEKVLLEEHPKPIINKPIKKLPVRNKKIEKSDKAKTSASHKTMAMKGKNISAKHFT
ncbi:uncharacterized protein LOC106663305 isoform X2 [Cimex lectularius]|uniref:Uncharacterized protein n=1 Tax=Cimex lectularius TaxID=79782 RepID=A0A8I6TEB7_CIMLE|nr:uncharacterized protein LOC106663305 isoform X2 [Cimex lectularius]